MANGLDKKVDRLGTLLEEVSGQVRAIAEGHGSLNTKLDRLATELSAHRTDTQTRLFLLGADLGTFKTDTGARLTRIEGRLDGQDARLGRIEHHLGLNGAAAPKRRALAKRKK